MNRVIWMWKRGYENRILLIVGAVTMWWSTSGQHLLILPQNSLFWNVEKCRLAILL